jgi:GAF domain-containing protein
LQQTREKEKQLTHSNQELEKIRVNLEEHNSERSTILERLAAQIQAAAEFGRVAASLRSQETLLSQAVDLIREKFGFYHAGIFLLDNKGEYAVLRAANSPGGQRMLARQHKLRVGDPEIVGRVTSTRKPHITQDVRADANYFDNPDLPETRSEMALPLQVGETILGALDVHSTYVNAFTQEDLLAMQVVAGQLAVAIQNARLLEEQQSALEAARRAYAEISQESWHSFLEQRKSIGYVASPESTRTASHYLSPEMKSAMAENAYILDEDTLSLPIRIRTNTTGVMRLKKGANAPWKAKEIEFIQDVAEQLSQTLEAARLYNDTQQRAERERLTAEIVNRIRTTNDPQSILQTALAELRQALGVQTAQVVLENGNKLAVSEGNGHAHGQEQA